MAPVQIRTNQSSRKKLVVYEDVASPEKEKEEEEDDEEIETCAPPSYGDRSAFLKSMRADHTFLPAEDLEESYGEDEEEEEEEGGVERYFKSVYNVAANFDEQYAELKVEAHDSDTEIEMAEVNPHGKDYEHALWLDFLEARRERLEAVQLVESDAILAMEKEYYGELESSDEENDENDESNVVYDDSYYTPDI